MKNILGILTQGIWVLALLIGLDSTPTIAGQQGEQQTQSQQIQQQPMKTEFRAWELLDKSVKNNQGERLGKIADFIINREGWISQVVLRVGGFVGIGQKEVAVPLKQITVNERGDLLYNATKEELKNSTEFDFRQQRLESAYAPYVGAGEDRYSYSPYRGNTIRDYSPYERRYYEFGGGTMADRYGESQTDFPRITRPEQIRASFLIGMFVVNKSGKELGLVEDLIFSSNGKVEDLVIGKGGILGIGEEQVRIPFRTLRVDNNDDLVLNVTNLDSVPGYREDKNKQR